MAFKFLAPFLLLLTSVFSALAAPAAATLPTKSFTLSVEHNRNRALNGQAINAAGRGLYLGLASPSTYCPSPPVTQCPIGNETAFSGLLSMNVLAPGGQIAYVEPDGALGYTQAHSASIPPGSFTSGFSWSPLHTDSKLGERGLLDFAAPGATPGGFYGCRRVPLYIPEATFKIFAQVPGFNDTDCTKLGKLRTTEFKLDQFGAWQYT